MLYSEKLFFLGYVVDGQGIRLDPTKCSTVQNIPAPTDKKSLERFLGLSGWCAKYVKNYATIVDPLNNLRRKGVQWQWTDKCDRAFTLLKTEIAKSVSLTIPDFEKPFEVHTDAGGVGLGAALMQRSRAGEPKVCFFCVSFS